MKNKIYCQLPIFATASFSVDKPDNWGEMSKEERDEHFLSATSLSPEGSLCHQCRRNLETDYVVDLQAIEGEELEWYEHA
jgi:hypothetical protein